ncbi:MAG: hypothetical protein HQL72_02465 [Magnetococcales bacterium]|nr:hypothetical protein [Magnetococcales bacterium]
MSQIKQGKVVIRFDPISETCGVFLKRLKTSACCVDGAIQWSRNQKKTPPQMEWCLICTA